MSKPRDFYFQVKFINCYLREIISFTKKLTLETEASILVRVYACLNTVNSEIFARDLFSRIAFKDIFATLKIATRA